MAGLRLLERLRLLENPPGENPGEDALLVQSVIDHVKRLLVTHKGTVPISDDYGMPDIYFSQSVDFKRYTRQLESAITELIAGFEPRLTRVKVECLSAKEDLLKQRFRIRSFLKRKPDQPLDFIIELSSEAKVNVLQEYGRD